MALNARLQQDISYTIRLEPGVQTPGRDAGEAFRFLSGYRLALGSTPAGTSVWRPASVSGYLIQLTPDVKSLDGLGTREADFTDLHAWAEGTARAGWIGLDPTSGLLPERVTFLACTPELASAAPVTGALDECETEFSHAMQVTRIWEAPRVTKPGAPTSNGPKSRPSHRIDGDLNAQDVRLTLGGEPTFVAVDDPDGAEWNTDAWDPPSVSSAADPFIACGRNMGPWFCAFRPRQW